MIGTKRSRLLIFALRNKGKAGEPLAYAQILIRANQRRFHTRFAEREFFGPVQGLVCCSS